MSEKKKNQEITEKEIVKAKGFLMLFVVILGILVSIAAFVWSIIGITSRQYVFGGVGLALSIVAFVFFCVLFSGFKVVNPKEALVLTLFGQYYGTIKTPGFFFVNPFCTAVAPKANEGESSVLNVSLTTSSGVNAATGQIISKKKVSLKTLTLNNNTQKVNDALGNPIIIGAVVIWKVADPTKAVFNVDDYPTFLSTQCDSTIRKITRLYPYDLLEEEDNEEGNEKTLRGSSQEIAQSMKIELQEKVNEAGLEIDDVRITHLSYSEEIAAAMLQKQQAAAVIAARKKIVQGAVGMVQMAIEQLGAEEIVVLDEERKAAMVSNLLVVLCGNKDAQPVVSSGSIY